MEYRELKNFGEVFPVKPSARVMMAAFALIPRELGFIGTPKFAAKLQSKDRYWKKKRFKTADEKGLIHQEFTEGIRFAIAFYTALIATCGKENAAEVYWKLTEKRGAMIYEEFFPSSEDFLRCLDPWEAIRLYFLEFFQAYRGIGAMQYEVVQNTESDLQIHVSDCAWDFMSQEAGYPEIASINGQCDLIFLPRLMEGIGGDFKRESWLCKGDATCDWHFCRYKSV